MHLDWDPYDYFIISIIVPYPHDLQTDHHPILPDSLWILVFLTPSREGIPSNLLFHLALVRFFHFIILVDLIVEEEWSTHQTNSGQQQTRSPSAIVFKIGRFIMIVFFLDPSPFLRLFLTVFHQSTALCHSALSSTCPVAGLQSSTYDQELKSSVARSIVSFFISKSPSASSLLLYLLLLLQFILQCLVFHHPITQRDHGGKAAVVVVETGDRCKQALAGDDSLPRGRRWRMWCKEEETPTDVMAVLCSWCLFAALLVAVALLMVIAYFHICWDQRSRRRRRSRAEASPTPSLVESWVSMVFLKNWFSVYFLPLPFSTSFSASSPPPSDRHLLIPR